MESNSRTVETTTLKRYVIDKENGKDVVWALFTRTFSDRKDPNKTVGILVNICLCDDAYLNQMAEGDVLPGVCNSREDIQDFTLVHDNLYHIPLGSMSYSKARRMAENHTTFLGRVRNWFIMLKLGVYLFP